MKTVGVWTGALDEPFCHAVLYVEDGSDKFLHAGLYYSPPIDGPTPGTKVIRINPETMETIDFWEGAMGEVLCTSLTYNLVPYGYRIYAGLSIIPAKVIKIAPIDMVTIDIWGGADATEKNCQALIHNNLLAFLYAGLAYIPGVGPKVVKINSNTMIVDSIWNDPASGDNCRALTAMTVGEDYYIFAGTQALLASPAIVTKIDPETMTTVDYWVGAANEEDCQALAHDDSYIFAGLNQIPAKVVKIDPVTMDKVGVWTGISGQNNCYALKYDTVEKCLFAGLGTSPANVIRINPETMLTEDSWTGADGEDDCRALDVSYGSGYVYAGLNTSPAKVIKLTKIKDITRGQYHRIGLQMRRG